jgi:sugar (pentulose or hexulose) kinase
MGLLISSKVRKLHLHSGLGAMTPGLLYRAAMEGITNALLAGFHSMQKLGMGEAVDICLVGGGARNKLWGQIIADIFQLPVR